MSSAVVPADPTQLTTSVSYHAWNKDSSMIAISPNTNEVWIYAAKGPDCTKWEKKWTLDEVYIVHYLTFAIIHEADFLLPV